jgi:prevent-host-death family protein
MKPLSACLNEKAIQLLRREVAARRFPGVTFEQAMQFLLTDGALPASGLPASSFLKLEDWARSINESADLVYTATELKNKTGEILEKVLQGKTVRIIKHGREVAEIRPGKDVV